MAAQPPVRTVEALSCQLSLSDLPERSAGGFLVSGTMAPVLDASGAPDAHVRGYFPTSVVTVQLRKKVGDK